MKPPNIKIQREIISNGGPNIGIAGNPANHAAYERAYDTFLKDGDVDKANQSMGLLYGTGEIASGTNKTYSKYYGDWYDENYGNKK